MLLRKFHLLVCMICGMALQAQTYHIDGFIKDSFTKEKIDSAQIALLNPEDSTVVEEFLGIKHGWWQCYRNIQKPGKYIMRFCKEGYHTAYKNVDFKYTKYRKTGSTFGEVLMYRLPKQKKEMEIGLGEAVVTATKIKMVMKGDTVIYNADAFQLSQGSMLDDLMKMLPGMEVRPNGEIFMNGEKVQSLLVNGQDFFKGDPKMALDNLPAYMVDKVKAYGRLGDKLVALGVTPEEIQRRKLPLVVDVSLKKEYSVGLTGNATAGYGTDNHYMARLFGLYFGPHTRVSLVANSNDMADNTYFDEYSQQWNGTGDAAGNTTMHGVWMDVLHNDAAEKWKLSNSVKWQWREQHTRELESKITFLDGGNVYSRYAAQESDRNWSMALNGTNSYTPKRGRYFELTPDVNYTNYENRNGTMSADYSAQLAEDYMGEALDSLFAPGSTEHYRRNLLASVSNSSFYKMQKVNAGGKLTGDMRFLDRQIKDRLSFAFGGSYGAGWLHVLNRNADADGGSRQTRFGDQRTRDYNYYAQAKYIYDLDFDKFSVDIMPSYRFRQDYSSDHRPYFQLAGTEYDTWDIDRLSSAKDQLTQVMDMGNTYYSSQWNWQQDMGVDIELSSYRELEDGWKRDHSLTFGFDFRNLNDKLHYDRAMVDTVARRTEWFFLPSFAFSLSHYSNKIRNEYSLKYDYSSSAPWIGYRVDYRDDATPLVVRYSNPGLKNAHTHHAEFKYGRKNNTRRSSHNLSFGYDLWENLLCQSMAYDATTGIRTYRPENIGGNWGTNGRYDFSVVIFPKHDIYLSGYTNANFRHSEDFVALADQPKSLRSKVDRLLLTQHLNLFYSNHKGFIVNASADATWNHSEGDRFRTLNAVDFNYGANITVPIVWGIKGQSRMHVYSRRGYSDKNFNSDRFIWSINLEKSVINGRLNIRAEVFDLLNKMSAYSYSINAQMQSESYRNVLRRYAMLSLTWRFNANKKRTK